MKKPKTATPAITTPVDSRNSDGVGHVARLSSITVSA